MGQTFAPVGLKPCRNFRHLWRKPRPTGGKRLKTALYVVLPRFFTNFAPENNTPSFLELIIRAYRLPRWNVVGSIGYV